MSRLTTRRSTTATTVDDRQGTIPGAAVPEIEPAMGIAPGSSFRRGLALRKGPFGFIAGRVGYAILILLVISLLVFIATQALPADPAEAILGKTTPERLAAFREDLGLNRPLTTQYVDWIGGVVTGDLGTSLATNQSVASMIGARLGNTLILMVVTASLAIPLSIVLGALAAIRRDSRTDRAGLGIAVIVASVPEFVTAMLLAMVFATTVFHVLPAVTLADSVFSFKSLALPVTILMLGLVPYLYRLVRASTIDVLESEYIHIARLKGLTKRRILFGHALPNALVPTIQASAFSLAYLLGGAIVVEYVFAYPGIGSLLLDAMRNHDLPVIQALTLLFAVSFMLFNLIADILTVLVTPRLRTGGS